MERRLVALALIAAGVGVQWGPGFALIVAGALFGLSGVEFSTAGRAVEVVRRAWFQARGTAAAMPRRTAAAVLVTAGILATSLGFGIGVLAVIVGGGMVFTVGAVLGWE
jgi:hypothetical protein